MLDFGGVAALVCIIHSKLVVFSRCATVSHWSAMVSTQHQRSKKKVPPQPIRSMEEAARVEQPPFQSRLSTMAHVTKMWTRVHLLCSRLLLLGQLSLPEEPALCVAPRGAAFWAPRGRNKGVPPPPALELDAPRLSHPCADGAVCTLQVSLCAWRQRVAAAGRCGKRPG